MQAYALEITSLRYGKYPDKVRLVLDMDQISDFRVFTLSSPYRIVIDLPFFTWRVDKAEKPVGVFISDIRQGKLDNGISRIVIDLNKPASIQKAFFLPKNQDRPDRLVIDYTPVDAITFEAKKSIIHGTLKTKEYTQVKTPFKNTAQLSKYIPIPPPNSNRPKQKFKNSNKNVVKPLIIDPGHGGVDPGALGHNRIYEKYVTLAIAKELRKQLLATGRYRVLLTRETDIFIKLKDRVKFARKHKGDLFISLHADSIKRKNVHGISIYTISKKASDAQTAALAKKENQADLIGGVGLDVEDKQVAFILGDFLMNETMNQSKFLANIVVRQLKNNGIKTLENPHRYAGFAVLKAPDIPSILIETGFMSNKKEAKLLRQKRHQQKISKAIRHGIDSYFKHTALNESN